MINILIETETQAAELVDPEKTPLPRTRHVSITVNISRENSFVKQNSIDHAKIDFLQESFERLSINDDETLELPEAQENYETDAESTELPQDEFPNIKTIMLNS